MLGSNSLHTNVLRIDVITRREENAAPFHEMDVSVVQFVKRTITRYARDTCTVHYIITSAVVRAASGLRLLDFSLTTFSTDGEKHQNFN